MNFRELIRVIALSFAQDIPYVGGIVRAYVAVAEKEHGRQEREREEQEFLNKILAGIEQSQGRKTREDAEIVLEGIADEGRQALTSTFVQGGAEAARHLVTTRRVFQSRFLYLASKNYASAALTAEIASQHGFLWRSYHAKGQNHGSVAGVDQIKSGDLIVLAYRDNGHFRILSPLIVKDQTAGNEAINDNEYQCSTNTAHAGRPQAARLIGTLHSCLWQIHSWRLNYHDKTILPTQYSTGSVA